MSTRPQPTPKQMILQQIMLAAVVFLGFNLFCNKPNQAGPNADNRNWQQILGDPNKIVEPKAENEQTLYWANSRILDMTATKINDKFQSAVDNAEKAKQITPEQAVDLRMQATVLVADTQLKGGIYKNDPNRMRLAFNTLQGWERKHREEPRWKTLVVPVAPPTLDKERLNWSTLTPDGAWEKTKEELSAKNKQDLVYGVFPGYQIIDSLVRATGSVPGFSYAFAAFLLALIVRAIIFPVAQRQLMWSRKMQQLQPLVAEIKAQYTDKKTKQVSDPQALQMKTMELYKEYGLNPLAGCLPAFIQFPLFITVYQFMTHYQIEFQKGMFLWINPSASSASHGFFAPNLGLIDPTLIIVYGITMVTSTLLMPVSDPSQIKQQRIMGVGMGLLITAFMFMGVMPVPAAFVLYWTFTNLLATAQSLRVYRMPLPPLEKVNTPTGGVYPKSPFGGGPSNGNGKTSNGTFTMPAGTGKPVKHKPKKRK